MERHILKTDASSRAPPPKPIFSTPQALLPLNSQDVDVSLCCCLSWMWAEQGGRGSALICLGRSVDFFFTLGRFDNFLVSSCAPSGLRQVDSTLGGSVGRGVSLDGRGGSSLVERGGIFWTGAEIPSLTQVTVACLGSFSPLGVGSSQFLAT